MKTDPLAKLDHALAENREFRNDLLRRRVDRLIECAAPAYGLTYWLSMVTEYNDSLRDGARPDPVWDDLFARDPNPFKRDFIFDERAACDAVVGLDCLRPWSGSTYDQSVLASPPDDVPPPACVYDDDDEGWDRDDT